MGLVKSIVLVGGSVGLGIAGGAWLHNKFVVGDAAKPGFGSKWQPGTKEAVKGGVQAVSATMIYGVAKAIAR